METSLLALSPKELARLAALNHLAAGSISQVQAAVHLRISVRQVKRLWRAFRKDGPIAVASRRRGRRSNRAVPLERLRLALELIKARYSDFGPTLASEKLALHHDLQIDHETLRRAMIAAGCWTASKRWRRRHLPRERRPCFGELIQIDGSHHAWFEDRGTRCVLLVAIDDATSTIVALRFEKQETTVGYFSLLRTYIADYGRPLAFYSDRDSIFRQTHPDQREEPTQFARAMQQLDIEIICANTPQAKGRVERANKTLQDRLVKELRLRNIQTITDANAFLEEYRAAHNSRFAKAAQSEANVHRDIGDINLERVLALQHIRTITKRGTISFINRTLVIDERAFVDMKGRRVTVTEFDDSRIEIQHANRQIPFIEILGKPDPAPVVTAKGLEAHHENRIKNPTIPAPNHPWRQYNRTARLRSQGTSLTS